MVAAVPMTPILPFFVAVAAAFALGPITSIKGTLKASPTLRATELTVPQAARTAFTFWESRKDRKSVV